MGRLTMCLHSEGANVWLHTALQMSRLKKQKCMYCTAEGCITSWAGCSQYTTRIHPIYVRHSDPNSSTPHHNYSRLQAKQEWPKVTLCQQETDPTDPPVKRKPWISWWLWLWLTSITRVKTADHLTSSVMEQGSLGVSGLSKSYTPTQATQPGLMKCRFVSRM